LPSVNKCRNYKAVLREFVDASGFATATLHEGKGFFCDHPSHIGTYFMGFSDPTAIAETYSASDALIFAGTSMRHIEIEQSHI
jgi:TPP-dependent 2-oxoacid decarboxylase